MLSQSTIDRIIDAANIVDVVSDYVTLRRSGASYKGLCPFHDDKTPSFYVSPAKGVCKCFSCGKGGNVVHFIMEQEQLTYYEALKFLAKKYGIEVEERELTPEQKQQRGERESMFAVNEWASKYFHDIMLNDVDGRAVGLAYFRSRGFRDDILEKFQLGYCPVKRTEMADSARRKGYKADYLVKTGLCFRKDDGTLIDKYSGRVIFPWFSVSGKIVAFGGRVLDARTKGVNQKYINSPESDIFHKSNELYGIFQAKKAIVKEERVYMVEGYTDVISMHQCGIENVVANSGTALNEAQIRLLHRFTSNITLLYDGDDAGIHAALRGTDMLLAEGMNVKILLLPDGDDPDCFARKHSVSEFKAYVEEHQTDFIIFKTNLLLKDAGRDPLKKAQLTKDIVRSISVIPEEIVRSAYVHECSELLRVEEQVLLRAINANHEQELDRIQKEKERERERAALAEKRQDAPAGGQSKTETVNGNTPSAEGAGGADAPVKAPMTQGDNAGAEEHASAPWEFPDDPPAEAIAQSPSGNEAGSRQAIDGIYSNDMAEQRRFHGLERMIMSAVVRHGDELVSMDGEDGEEASKSVVEYVRDELEVDGIQLKTPLYSRMLDSVSSHVNEPDFKASHFFLTHPDVEISVEAADLMTDKYQLSSSRKQIETDALNVESVSHLMIDYKFEVVENEMRRLQAELSNPEVSADSERCQRVLEEYMKLSNTQRCLAKMLGDRVVFKG